MRIEKLFTLNWWIEFQVDFILSSCAHEKKTSNVTVITRLLKIFFHKSDYFFLLDKSVNNGPPDYQGQLLIFLSKKWSYTHPMLNY